MKLLLFGENKKVLLLGEGNFSFALTLVKQNLNIDLTATCYENDIQETVKRNINILEKYGTRVLLGVDATKLEKHNILSLERFDIVVFNFPHVGGKMKIDKNRELLKNFFVSVKYILAFDSQIFMTLCNGQGGTAADKPIRKWSNSWQVTEMAAHGDFGLINIEPFDSTLFDTYKVTGYRSLEKEFNTKGSLVHIFKLFDRPNIQNIGPKNKISLKISNDLTLNWKTVILENKNNEETIFNNLLHPNYYKFDITFYVTSEFNISKFYQTLYNYAGRIIDNVEFLRSYQFLNSKETLTFRITYTSEKFPLHRKLIIYLHENVIADIIESAMKVSVSR